MNFIWHWKPKKVVIYIFIVSGKDMVLWSKIGGQITDGNRPIYVLDGESNHENGVTFMIHLAGACPDKI